MASTSSGTYAETVTREQAYTWVDLEVLTLLVRRDIEDLADRLRISLVNNLGPDRNNNVDNRSLCKSLRDDITALLRDRLVSSFYLIFYFPYVASMGGYPLEYRASYVPWWLPRNADWRTVSENHIPLELPSAARGKFGVVVRWSDRFLSWTNEQQHDVLRNLQFRWVAAPRFVPARLLPPRDLVAYGRRGSPLALRRTVELPEG